MSDAVPEKWVASHIESQKGKLAIVTGANSGVGYITALELVLHGADVIVASRTESKGQEAVRQIQEEIKLSPGAGSVEFRQLDVSSLASIKAFADNFKATHDRLDLLVNNAGIWAVPFALSVDGIESQFATNHLGPFALTAHLMEPLKNSANARIVNVSSLLHRNAKMDLNAIVATKDDYDDMGVYDTTKLYNLLFTYELNRRFHAHGIKNVIAVAAHPGLTATNLGGPMMDNSWWRRQVWRIVWKLPMVGTPETGALPQLYAATASNVKADDYFGPDNLFKTKGHVAREESKSVSKSEIHALKLWEVSERLANLTYEF